MPTVLRLHGFRVSVLFPPREHPPPHVHVRNAMGVVVIDLAHGAQPQSVRKIYGMSRSDARHAGRIVAQHTDLLLEKWSEIWGS